jgi:Sap, sulfolipid-1-addressing protein
VGVHGDHPQDHYLEGGAVFGLSGLVLAKLATPALVVALSPVPIVVALVLLIHNDRPRASSIAYLLGRLISLVALTMAFMHVPQLLDGLKGPSPPWADWVVMAVGVVLVVLGARLWWRRTTATDKPGWEGKVGRITPTVSAAIGSFPMLVHPKVLAASAAAGMEIATVRMTVAAVAAVAYYAALASSTVAVPILAYLVFGPRIDPKLERIRRWIQDRYQAITAIVSVVVGLAVVLYGSS